MTARGSEPAERLTRTRATEKAAAFALALAFIAMIALHVVQPAMSPLEEPISFYIHGARGWLLSAALALFGGSAILVAIPLVGTRSESLVPWMVGFGGGMLIDAAVRSDPWFPWESSASLSGLVHAAAAIAAPPLLLVPMVTYHRRLSQLGLRRFSALLVATYFTALCGSGASLGWGFVRDIAPPLIGVAERLLAMAAVLWIALLLRTWERKSPTGD